MRAAYHPCEACGAEGPGECPEFGRELEFMSTPELLEQADNGCGMAHQLAQAKLSPPRSV